MGRYGEIEGDIGRYREISGDMGRYGEVERARRLVEDGEEG
jgi:hypothetical protein